MWPLPPIHNQHVHIIIGQESIACYWIRSGKNGRFTIEAYQHDELPAASDDLFYNLTELQKVVNRFLKQHALTHAYGHYVLAKPLAQEHLIEHSKSHALLKELITIDNHHTHYAYDYLGPGEQQHVYYVCGISESLLLQLTLLHNTIPLFLQSIRPPLATELRLYNFLHGKQLSQAQLVQAIDTKDMRITNIFSYDALQPLFNTNVQDIFSASLVYALASHIGVSS